MSSRLFTLTLMLGVLSVSQISFCQPLRAPTQKLLRPILDAEVAVLKQDKDYEKAIQRVQRLLAALYKNRSPEADECAVILLDYYLGEADRHDLLRNITLRGRRVLPYLAKYSECPAKVGATYPPEMLIKPEYRAEDYELVLEHINQGKILPDD